MQNLIDWAWGAGKNFIKVVIMLVGVVIVGVAIVGLVTSAVNRKAATVPSMASAPYGLTVVATGETYLTSKFDVNGTAYTMYGFWQPNGKGFTYDKHTITLDSKYFGQIMPSERTK